MNDDKGVGTYRNLTKALAENIKIIEECTNDWKAMWSIYKTDENDANSKVAVWMQNSKGEISQHRVFDILFDINTAQESYCNKGNQLFKIIDDACNDKNLKSIVIPTSDTTRGIGKTRYLISKALEVNGVYVAPKAMCKLAKSINANVNTACSYDELRGFSLDTTLFIDELVILGDIENVLKNYKYNGLEYTPVKTKKSN